MKKLLIILIFILHQLTNAEAGLDIFPDTVYFGIVPLKSNYYKEIVLRSIGSDTLFLDSIETICPCIELPMPQNFIPPGDSMVIRLKFDSEYFVGIRDRYPHFYSKSFERPMLLGIKTIGASNPGDLKPIAVKPFKIMASQFGDKVVTKFPFRIINSSEETVPLKLIYWDEEFYNIYFPDFVPPKETVEGYILLNEKGVKTEFENSFTFEFIDELSTKKYFSIPIIRKFYKREAAETE
jgi:hypothetical protein